MARPWTPGPFESLSVARSNTRQPHVPLRSFATRDGALGWSTLLPPGRPELDEAGKARNDRSFGGAPTPSVRVQRLDGRWQARFVQSPAAPDVASESDDAPWFPIDVPGCWQRQPEAQDGLREALKTFRGLTSQSSPETTSEPDPPQYLNFRYPIPVDPPTVPELNPTAVYRRSFPTPTASSLRIDPVRSGWQEIRACWRAGANRDAFAPLLPFRSFLRIGSADAGARVWLNGSEVGWATDSRLPAEWEVTGLLRAPDGPENVLTVVVPKYAASTYLEDQDTWRLTGILRSVDLTHKPWASVSNLRVRTPLAFGEEAAWSGGGRGGDAVEAEGASQVGEENADVSARRGPLPSDGVPLGSYLCRFQPLVSASLVVDVDLELPPALLRAGDEPSASTRTGVSSSIPTPVGAGRGVEAGDRTACDRARVVVELWRQDRAALADARARGLIAEEALDRVFADSNSQRRLAWSGEAVPEPLWRARDGGGSGARAGRLVRGARATIELADAAEALWPGEKVDPPLWSAEAPNLWTLVVRLEYKSDAEPTEISGQSPEPSSSLAPTAPSTAVWNTIEHETAQVGFRQTWIRDGTLVHNGRPLVLRGANRHEFDPVTGRPPREGLLELDLSLLRRLSFNAVRLSHYPNDDAVYESCNAFGLFVVDEANVETHGFDPGLKGAALDPADAPGAALEVARRVQAMQERDLNHPCVALWSLGNESGLGAGHLAAAGYLRFRDPSRPVHYEGGGSRSAATDVVCPMYARVRQLQWLADLEWEGVRVEGLPPKASRADDASGQGAPEAATDGGRPRALLKRNEPVAAPPVVLTRIRSAAPPSASTLALAPYPHPFPRPVVLCEYSHSMANSGGDMALYWDAFRADSRLCGGFVWDWADESFLAGPRGSFGDPLAPGAPEHILAAAGNLGGDHWATETFRKEKAPGEETAPLAALPCHDASPVHSAPLFLVGGDFGDDPHDAQFCCNGVVGADRLVHPSGIELSAAQFPVEVRRDRKGDDEGRDDKGRALVPLVFETSDAFLTPNASLLRVLVRLRLGGAVASGWEEPLPSGDADAWQLSGFARHALRKERGVPVPGRFERPVRVERRVARVPASASVLEDPAQLATLDVLIASGRDELWGPTGTVLKRLQVPLWDVGASGDVSFFGTSFSPLPVIAPLPPALPGAAGDPFAISTSSGASFSIDPKSGLLASVRLSDGTELLSSSLTPCFYRAPTDNDRGGSGGSSHAARWAAAGLDRLAIASASVRRDGASVVADLVLEPAKDGSGAVGGQVEGVGVGELGGTHWLAGGGEGGKNERTDSEKEAEGFATAPAFARVRVALAYAASASGGLQVRVLFDAREALPGGDRHGSLGTLPRVGLCFSTAAGLPRGTSASTSSESGVSAHTSAPIEWLGLGPHETYPDRLRSGQLARHKAPRGAVDAHVPYVYPGESGGRSEVCWLSLRSGRASLSAIAVPFARSDRSPADGRHAKRCQSSDGPSPGACGETSPVPAASEAAVPLPESAPRFAQVSFTPFSLEELVRATHDAQLPAVENRTGRATHVHLDAAHAGVGGDDSWSPAILPRYLVRPGIFRMSFELLAEATDSEASGDRAHAAWSRAAMRGLGDEGSRWWLAAA